MTYIDKLFDNAKKHPERVVPGPNKYNNDPIKHVIPKEISQKWGKDKRISAIQKIFETERKTVAPNAYKIDET